MKTKSQTLLDLMMRNYPHGVSYKRLSLITPAYSQRFGEWKDNSIFVEQFNIERESHYKLKTPPWAIDPALIERIDARQGVLL